MCNLLYSAVHVFHDFPDQRQIKKLFDVTSIVTVGYLNVTMTIIYHFKIHFGEKLLLQPIDSKMI